jgi:hypothetical protein
LKTQPKTTFRLNPDGLDFCAPRIEIQIRKGYSKGHHNTPLFKEYSGDGGGGVIFFSMI